MFLTTTVNSQKKKQSQEYNYLIIITGKNWNIQQPYHYNTTFNMYKHKNKLYFYHGKKKTPNCAFIQSRIPLHKLLEKLFGGKEPFVCHKYTI